MGNEGGGKRGGGNPFFFVWGVGDLVGEEKHIFLFGRFGWGGGKSLREKRREKEERTGGGC